MRNSPSGPEPPPNIPPGALPREKNPNAPRYAPLVHRYLIKPSPVLQINPNHQFSELSAPVAGPGFTTQKAHPALPMSQDIQM